MRERLSKDLTLEIYEHYKNFYNMFQKEINEDIKKKADLKKLHDGMRIRAAQIKTTNRSEYKKNSKECKENRRNF